MPASRRVGRYRSRGNSKQEPAQKDTVVVRTLTKLVDDTAINTLIDQRLMQTKVFKRQKAFKDFDQWPADAQLDY